MRHHAFRRSVNCHLNTTSSLKSKVPLGIVYRRCSRNRRIRSNETLQGPRFDAHRFVIDHTCSDTNRISTTKFLTWHTNTPTVHPGVPHRQRHQDPTTIVTTPTHRSDHTCQRDRAIFKFFVSIFLISLCCTVDSFHSKVALLATMIRHHHPPPMTATAHHYHNGHKCPPSSPLKRQRATMSFAIRDGCCC